MCGSTGAQNTIQDEQMQFYQQMQEMTAQQYQEQQAIYAPMAKQFQTIFDAGPNQKGFSAGEEADLNAQAEEGVSKNYNMAAKVTNEEIAAQGGGNEYMPSGGADLTKAQVADSAAQTQSGEQTEIQMADYNQGYSEWQAAGAGLLSIAAGDNPLGYAGVTNSSGSAASQTANDIAQQNNSWINAAIGAAGAAAGGWAGGGFKHP